MNKPTIPSGNAAIDRSPRKGTVEVYDRGELLWLIAANVIRGGDLEHLAGIAKLTAAEIADVRTMSD
jgi:hypothetical protein